MVLGCGCIELASHYVDSAEIDVEVNNADPLDPYYSGFAHLLFTAQEIGELQRFEEVSFELILLSWQGCAPEFTASDILCGTIECVS